MERFNDIWVYRSSAYINLTDNTLTNTDFDFISGATDIFYFGLNKRYVGIYCDLTSNGSYTGISYEYFDGNNWNKLALIDSYSFNTSKYIRWVLPSIWVKDTFEEDTDAVLPDTDTYERYWIRIKCTGVNSKAIIHKIRAIPFVEYTTPTKVNKLLEFRKPFDYNTTPSDQDVEDFIRRAEDLIDYRTKKSWRFNSVTEDYDPVLVDYNRYGFFMRHRNFIKVYSVSIWTGNSWQQLIGDGDTGDRTNDYFTNKNLGMIYFTRLFLLPAAYGMTGRYFHWGFGEYKNSVQVDYAYGRDSETDPEFYIVEDIATKMAAIDCLRHHDYSSFFVSGTDKVALDAKVQELTLSVEEKIDNLTGLALS
jgi:hypothetical protein